jgi:hypothetical protein
VPRLPHLDQLGQDLVEHGLGEVGLGDAEALLLGGGAAPAHAQLEAPAAQVVEHGDLLGGAERVVHRRGDVEDARPDVDALGRRRAPAEERLVGREVRVLLQEVVLGGPQVLEAGAVGGLHPLELLLEPDVLGRVPVLVDHRGRHVHPVEDPELHGREL